MKTSLKRKVFDKVHSIVLKHSVLMRFSTYILNYFPAIKFRLKRKLDNDAKLQLEPSIESTTEEFLRLQTIQRRVIRTIEDIRNERIS